ncbi:MAG TPA: heme-binding domain-containing protein [Lentimicrobium sp.]|nr:heme-binding domain-containing protein [Lentimicrobium sp.]
MKAVKILLVALILIFIAIQFIPSGIPQNTPEDDRSIVKSGLVTEAVLQQLKISCYDCHSNQVNLPWYAKVAPSSWLLSDHIREGKDHLNFSEWSDYSKRKKISLLEHIGEEVKSGGMPLKSYLLIHRDARLNSGEVSALVSWTEEASGKILQ